jgi:hypothetical protein
LARLFPPVRCFFDGDRGDGVTVLLLRFDDAADGELEPEAAAPEFTPAVPELPAAVDCDPGDAIGLVSVGMMIGRIPILHIGQFAVLFFAIHTL